MPTSRAKKKQKQPDTLRKNTICIQDKIEAHASIFLCRYSSLVIHMQAFIFDFDGVIVDSERYWGPQLTEMIAKHLPGWTEEDDRQFKGLNMHRTHELLQEKYNYPLSMEDFSKEVDVITDLNYGQLCQLIDGATELFDRLEHAGVPYGIASSSQSSWIRKALERFKLDHRFDVIVTPEQTNYRGKPHPDVYLLAAEKLGADPTKTIAIEDSRFGSDAALAAGMTCIGLRTDLNPEQDLSRTHVEVDSLHKVTPDLLSDLSSKWNV